jgi:hypothetical protein
VPIPVDALFCGPCDGYVHPFLDACPTCGAARTARYDAALAAPDLGFRALLTEPRVVDRVRETAIRYSMKALGGSDSSEVRDGFATVAGALAYVVRTAGATRGESEAAFVHLAGDDLVVGERGPAREVLRVPLAMVLAVRAATKGGTAADAWAGLAALGRRDELPLPPVDGDLVVTFAGPDGLGRVGIGNRRGIFVARARGDHYPVIGRWLGILAAAAAEARWAVVGPAAHAAELGLGAPGAPAMPPAARSVPGVPAVAAVAPAAGGPTSVGDALATLEDLRERGLVTDAEYAAKRSEILARL